MTPFDYYMGKMLAVILFAWLAAMALTSCGVSTPGGYVAGTTGYLEEYNRGMIGAPMDNHSEKEKRQLDDIIRRY